MSNFELIEFSQLPAPLTQLTFTPYGQAFLAKFATFVKYASKFDNGQLDLKEVNSLDFKYNINRFIVIPEIQLGLVHAGGNVYAVDLQTFKQQKILSEVSQLVPHHPGFEPICVPLNPIPQQITITSDLQQLPFHPTISGLFKAISLPQKPLFKDKFAQFDFIAIQNNRINTIVCFSKRELYDTPCQFGSGALETYCFDQRTQNLNSLDVQNTLTYEIIEQLSGFFHGDAEINSPLWMGDKLYYESESFYHAVDIKLLKFQMARGNLKELSIPIIEMPKIGQFATLNKSAINNIRPFGTLSNPLILQTAVNAEAVRRLKKGVLINKIPLNTQNCGSTLYNLDKLTDLTEQSFAIKDNYGASFLREALGYQKNTAFECGGIANSQKATEIQIDQNIQPARLLEAIHKQLSIQNSNQSQQYPHLFVAFPCVVAFNLDQDWYFVDNEQWGRKSLEEITDYKGTFLRRIHSSIVCATGNEVYYQHGNGENVVFQKQMIIPDQQFLTRIQTIPINANLFCQQQYDIMSDRASSVQYTPFLLSSQQHNYRIVKRRFSQVLIDQIRKGVTFEDQELKRLRLENRDLPDQLEFSLINAAIGIAFYNRCNFMEAAQSFLDARLVSPLEVVQLFLVNVHVTDLTNNVQFKRAQMPPIEYLVQCEIFKSKIGQLFVALHDNDYWSKVVESSGGQMDRDVHVDEWLEIKTSQQEESYEKMFYGLPTLPLLLNMFDLEVKPENKLPAIFVVPTPDQIEEQIKALLFYLRIYLDTKGNWQPILRTILRNSIQQGVESKFVEQLITPAIQMNRQSFQKDEQRDKMLQVLRCIMCICLSAKPLNIPQQLSYVFMVHKPEDLQNVITQDNFQKVVSLYSSSDEIISGCVSLFALFRYFFIGSRVLQIIKNNDLGKKIDCIRSICVLNSYGSLITQDNKKLIETLTSIDLTNIQEKLILWQFIPYLAKADLSTAVQLLSRKVKYSVKKGDQQEILEQPLFFEHFQFKKSGSMAGYYKPSSSQAEKIEEFALMFTPQLLQQLLHNLRYQDLPKNSDLKVSKDVEMYHCALVQIAIFYVSQCIAIAFSKLDNQDYKNVAPNWKNSVIKLWLSEDAASFISWLLPLQVIDGDEAQIRFANQALVALEGIIIRINELISANETDVSDNQIPSQLSDGKSSCISVPHQQIGEISQGSDFNAVQKQLGSSQTQVIQKDSYNRATYDQLLKQFQHAYLLAAVKAGEQQIASNNLFLQVCEPRGKFTKLFNIAFQLHKKGLVSENIASTKEEHLQKIFAQIKEFKECKFQINLEGFESIIQTACSVSLPFYREIAASKSSDFEIQQNIINKQRLFDCMAFAGVEKLGQAGRSPVAYLYDLALRLSIITQLEMIDINQFNTCIARLLSTKTESGELLAQFCLQRVLSVMPRNMPTKTALEFMQSGFKLQHLESGRHAIEQVKVGKQLTEEQDRLLQFQQSTVTINAFTKCDNCGVLLLKGAGTLQFRSMVRADGSLGVKHLDCELVRK